MRWVAPGQCQGNGVRTVSKQMVNGMSDGKLAPTARGATLFFEWSLLLPMGNSRQFDFEASTDFQFFAER